MTTFSNIWKETGWNSIIYIAAISGIDQSLYEAAELDGAGRFQKMWHVTLPGIKSTIVVLLIMNLGWVLNASFEVPYILGSGLLQDVSQTIDIFVLKYGMSIGNYSLATAAGIIPEGIQHDHHHEQHDDSVDQVECQVTQSVFSDPNAPKILHLLSPEGSW